MAKKLKKKKDFSAGGLVWDAKKRKVLMVFVENLLGQKVWTFPKGHPDGKETDQAAALREVREETGWNCVILKNLLNVHYRYTHKNLSVQKTVRWFLMRPVKKVGVFDPEEVIRTRWFTRAQAKKRASYQTDHTLLSKLASIGADRRCRLTRFYS